MHVVSNLDFILGSIISNIEYIEVMALLHQPASDSVIPGQTSQTCQRVRESAQDNKPDCARSQPLMYLSQCISGACS